MYAEMNNNYQGIYDKKITSFKINDYFKILKINGSDNYRIIDQDSWEKYDGRVYSSKDRVDVPFRLISDPIKFKEYIEDRTTLTECPVIDQFALIVDLEGKIKYYSGKKIEALLD